MTGKVDEMAGLNQDVCDDWTRGSVWQHIKTGHVYSVIGKCRLEATNAPAVLYTRPEDGIVWARDMDEFLDGRFCRILIPAMGLLPHELDAAREALWTLVTKPDVDGTAPTTAQIVTRILAAGWMPRPEQPGSPEWEAMVERGETAARLAFESDRRIGPRETVAAILRAALGTGDALEVRR